MDFPTVSYSSNSPHCDWPFGGSYRAHADLAGHLHQVGQWHARKALRLYSSEDEFEQLDAAVSLGTSVELLAKSLLASVNPILLLPPNSETQTLMKYSGTKRADVEGLDALSVKSLDASKALERLRIIKLAPVWKNPEDNLVLSVRNAAAHMGVVQQDLLRTAIRSMVRFAEHTRVHFGQTPEFWWGGELATIAPGMVEADSLAWEGIVRAKFAAAKMRIAELKQGLPGPDVDRLLASMTGSWRTSMEHNETTECPCCGYTGWVTGTVDRGAGETQYTEIGWPTFYSVLHIYHFECNVCGLRLTDGAELDIAGVEAEIDFQDDDYSPEPDF